MKMFQNVQEEVIMILPYHDSKKREKGMSDDSPLIIG